MIKVKEYLDYNFHSCEKSSSTLKSNGHYHVRGNWIYPMDYDPVKANNDFLKLTQEELKSHKAPDHIIININNETLLIGNTSVDGNWSKYNYLQTYEHIPRGEPDDNGYYARSTDEEIIKYIDDYLFLLKLNSLLKKLKIKI